MSHSRIRGRAKGGMAIGCLGLDTLRITFSTSDFPPLMNWSVRVTKTVRHQEKYRHQVYSSGGFLPGVYILVPLF